MPVSGPKIFMFPKKTVGYCRFGDMDVYMDRVGADAFDKALSKFSGSLGIDKAGSAKKKKGSGRTREYAFSNILGGGAVEICYNPDTRLLVVGSKDKSRIEKFLSCICDDMSGRGMPAGREDLVERFVQDRAAKKEKGVLSRAKDSISAIFSSKKEHSSLLDTHPELYHVLDDKEKRLLDEYESQLMDTLAYALRKDVMASHIGKINSYLETAAGLSKEYTVLEEKNIDKHDRFMDDAGFWKDLDYLPSY